VRSGAPFIILFGLPAARKERRSAAKKPDQNGSADAMRRRRNEAATFNQGRATMPNDPTATPTELHWLTIADAAHLIETRRLSPVELTRLCQLIHLRSRRPEDVDGRRLRDHTTGDRRAGSKGPRKRQRPDPGLPGGADR
jgi:hypothetical protein